MAIKLIPVFEPLDKYAAAHWTWDKLAAAFEAREGFAFFRHPNIGTGRGIVPDFAAIVSGFGGIVVRVLDCELNEIKVLESSDWCIRGKIQPPPEHDLDDLKVTMEFRFNSNRQLRNRVPIHTILALPAIRSDEFYDKIAPPADVDHILFVDGFDPVLPQAEQLDLDDDEWRLAQSILQTASILTAAGPQRKETTKELGPAIRILEREIALLDDQQTKAAFQIPPGPQRIRGLAGTGKTVLLARKAATIHAHEPDAKILFTFHTQSLYNQTRDLVSRFYRNDKGTDPDWNQLHVRHAWGGKWTPGVYAELSARQGEAPLTFRQAKAQSPDAPFNACCESALKRNIAEEYDYILMDEAQDFPKSFFRLIYRLGRPPKRIYFAFDELQSLSQTDIPTADDLFGVDDAGKPLVDLDGEYPGGMEKDLVLFKSYRCPNPVLMIAHGMGLGIKSKRGCVQMISSEATWSSIGYEVDVGPLTRGTNVSIRRPPDNSPNRVAEIYAGKRDLVRTYVFGSRDDELDWVADEIVTDVRKENVPPEKIVVISLDSIPARTYMSRIQRRLLQHSISSVIPGLVDDSSEFAEAGHVTLSTVYRAKGNEAPIVYIISFDSLYDYVREVELRNRAFTSISRSKAFVTISGTGSMMKEAAREIAELAADVPAFRFVFPDMSTIARNLDAAEALRRKREVATVRKSAIGLTNVDAAALSALPPKMLEELEQRIREARKLRGED